VIASTTNIDDLMNTASIGQPKEVTVIIRQTILAALCGAMTALGAATAVTALSSSPADARSFCKGLSNDQVRNLYCNTRNSPPVKRKVDGTTGINHPRITKRR
jgi:hypothetical protein